MSVEEPGRRFSDLVHRLGGGPEVGWLYAALAAAWAEPHRVYHGTGHLRECLAELDGAPADGADRSTVEAALWFHDAVYDPRSSDNEARSAAWAERALREAGVDPATAAEVGRLVLLTRHVEPAGDPGGALVCDVDLSILGRPPAVYDEFERGIRAEYAWVPEPVYRAERARILAQFLAREPLYRTGHFRARYEAPARENLSRAVARLSER
ncbi:MAG TPA: hypothetical protein VFR81_05695 [Longimicrobium sp.]|nr:hypothetical protein [Longimicrobium sp.]